MASDEEIVNAARGIVFDLGITDAVDKIDQPHVAGCYDPEGTPTNIAEYMTLVHGPYPDLLSALEAAEANAAELNRLNGPNDPDWVPFILPINPPWVSATNKEGEQ